MSMPDDFPEIIARFYDLPDEFYKSLIDSLDSGVYLVDLDRRIVYWNETAQRMSGYTSEEVIGRWCGDGLLKHVDFEGNLLCGVGCPLKETMSDGVTRQTDVFMKHKDGHRLPVRVIANPVNDRSGELIGAVETFNDITPDLVARMKIKKLTEDARKDPLTGVDNRRAAERTIADAVALWDRDRTPFGLLFVDLDNLKQINDQLGHQAGDAAIQLVARTLRALFRQDDLVARWGGDEFVILVKDINTELLDKMAAKAELGVGAAEMPDPFSSQQLSISIGAAMVQEDDTQASIVSRADRIMYQSKQAKKSSR
jgi:diguanylate cyclase (GGDEF)-like protein/PAS domain S-box-containing protein